MFFENITVKPATSDTWFEGKVNAIITLRADKIETTLLEKEINEKIFDLYELDDSERALIAGNADTAISSEDSTSAMSLSDRE